MFRQILYAQWKGIRFGMIPLVIAAFGLPLLAVQTLGGVAPGGEAGRYWTQYIIQRLQLWLPLFPALAGLVGSVLALNAWSWDHRGDHVYALSLPVPRWQYALTKMEAGALLLLVPAFAFWVGSLLATAGLDIPEGLRAYPSLLSLRFLLAALLAYAVLFALAAGSMRTTLIIVTALVGGLLGSEMLVGFAGEFIPAMSEWSPTAALFGALIEWPGPFDVFTGSWMLIDV